MNLSPTTTADFVRPVFFGGPGDGREFCQIKAADIKGSMKWYKSDGDWRKPSRVVGSYELVGFRNYGAEAVYQWEPAP
jgi:hypothetical protein